MSGQSPYGRHVYQPGEVIFREGDESSQCAYIVESGKIQISKKSPKGQKILGFVGPGGIFGEMALIDNAPRMAQAEATEMSGVTVIDEARLDAKLTHADPHLRALFAVLVKDIRELSEKMTES